MGLPYVPLQADRQLRVLNQSRVQGFEEKGPSCDPRGPTSVAAWWVRGQVVAKAGFCLWRLLGPWLLSLRTAPNSHLQGWTLELMFELCNVAPMAVLQWIKDAQLTQVGSVRLSFPEAELGTETLWIG